MSARRAGPLRRVIIDTVLLAEHYNALVSGEALEPVFGGPFSHRLSPAMTSREAALIKAAYLAGLQVSGSGETPAGRDASEQPVLEREPASRADVVQTDSPLSAKERTAAA